MDTVLKLNLWLYDPQNNLNRQRPTLFTLPWDLRCYTAPVRFSDQVVSLTRDLYCLVPKEAWCSFYQSQRDERLSDVKVELVTYRAVVQINILLSLIQFYSHTYFL